MFDDDPKPRGLGPLSALETEVLSSFSLGDLDDRIVRLHAEIERTQGMKAAKQQAMDAAGSLFKS